MACRRVLEAKYKLGLFDRTNRQISQERLNRAILTAENLKTAKEAAMKSIVLLENNQHLLPLNKSCKIALIGPFANSKSEMFSSWSRSGSEKNVITIFEGLKKIDSTVVYAQGTQVSCDTTLNRKLRMVYNPERQQQLVAEALAVANKSDVIIAVLGESTSMSGESTSRTDISIPACQRELLKALKGTGKPVVLLLTNGRPLTIQDDLKNADAILETWRLGTEAGNAIADVIFGNYNPSGKLTMTFPRTVGQIPIYYNCKNTGRPSLPGQSDDYVSNYKDQSNTPLYPFGYGLSYTTFKYGKVILSDTLLNGSNKTLKAKISITNNGNYNGEENSPIIYKRYGCFSNQTRKRAKTIQKDLSNIW